LPITAGVGIIIAYFVWVWVNCKLLKSGKVKKRSRKCGRKCRLMC